MPLVICNEPVKALERMRSPRIWREMLKPDLPGKLILSQIQLNHKLVDESPEKLDTKLLALYSRMIEKFAALHGETTPCFFVRAPESLELVGLHVQKFGGATNGIACLETALCVSPRTDGKVSISHVDDKFPAAEFHLAADLPKSRVLDWPAFALEKRSSRWTDVIKGALQYYVNRHKGPTGRVELEIPGLNIVAGAILPEGAEGHCDSTLAVAGLIAVMAVSGEWGRIPLAEIADWCAQAQECGGGRRGNIGSILFSMPGEIVHTNWEPARPKTHALAAGHVFLSAFTGIPAGMLNASARVATTEVGMALLRQHAAEVLGGSASACGAIFSDEFVYHLLKRIPPFVSRAQALAFLRDETTKSNLRRSFTTHEEPSGGYNVREKLLFVLAETQRAARAGEAIRAGDAARLGAFMNVGQVGEAGICHEIAGDGRIAAALPIHHASSDEDLLSMADGADPLWRQSGRSGASTPETDQLCDLAMSVNGVLGARYSEPQRVAILCKREVATFLTDRLVAGYYAPRKLSPALAMQVSPARGAGIVEG